MTETDAPRPRRRRSRLGAAFKRWGEKPGTQRFLGRLAAGYIRFVGRTSRLVAYEGPYDYFNDWDVTRPILITMWHGQHFMLPIVRRPDHPVKVMISLHRDGEINAIAAERLGVGTIRGSAARDPSRVVESGAIRGFLQMKSALEEGTSVCMTADLSRTVARRAGNGVVALARATGVPIVSLGVATSRRIEMKSWDRAALNLPFSRMAMVVGEFIYVPADADDDLMETRRREVEAELNRVTERAHALADAPRRAARGALDGGRPAR